MSDGPHAITIRLPQALAEHNRGDRDVTLMCAPGATLGDVLEQLLVEAPAVSRRIRDETGAIRRFVNVYVGPDECRTLQGLQTVVPSGTVVSVIPSVAGG